MARGSIVVFVALPEEMEYIYKYLTSDNRGECGRNYSKSVNVYPFTLFMKNGKEYEALFQVLPSMGNLSTASIAAKQIAGRWPHLCFLVGISGSLDPQKYRLGDVIVSTSVKSYAADKLKQLEEGQEKFYGEDGDATFVIDPRKRVMNHSFFRFRRQWIERENSTPHAHDYGKRWRDTKHKPRLIPIDKSDIEGISDEYANPTPSVHVQALLGSDFVVDSAEFVDFVTERNVDDSKDFYRMKDKDANKREFDERNKWNQDDLSAVDMESWGFFNIAEHLSPGPTSLFFSIRGISDLSAGKSTLDKASKNEVRSAAAKNAIHIMWELMNYLDERAITGG